MSPMRDDDAPDAPKGRDEEAVGWCLRFAEYNLSSQEREAFDRWLGEPGNREAFETAIAVWQGVEGAAGQPEALRLRARALENFRRLQRRRWAWPGRRRWPRVAVAAMLVLAAGSALWLLRVPADVYATGIGERRTVMLADGSRVSLDAASRVEARITRERRELRLLSGRARFDVAKDALRPFTVAAGRHVVVATGTAFSVELAQEQLHVILYEGRVEVLDRAVGGEEREGSSPGRTLVPGQELVASLVPATGSPAAEAPAAVAAVTPARVDAARSLSWEHGQLNFDNEPLSLAVERVNRYAREPLVIADPVIAALPVNGVFTAGDTAAFVEGATRLLPVDATPRDGEIVLQARKDSR